MFLSYKFALGPIDVTIGNIAFFIDRRATTYEKDVLEQLTALILSGLSPTRLKDPFLP